MNAAAEEHPNPLQHPLLASVGCPATGNGALVYLQNLARALEACTALGIGAYTSQWLQSVKALTRAVHNAKQGSASATASDLVHQPWGNIHSCIDARSKVGLQSTKHIDALLGVMLVEAAAGTNALTTDALTGIRTCYRALSGGRQLHLEWTLLATPSLLDEIQLREQLKGLSHPPVRAFGQLVLNYLTKPMATPAGLETVRMTPTDLTLSANTSAEELSDWSSVNTTANSEPTAADGLDEDVDGDTATAPRFQRGDSIIAWHHNRAQYSSRNNRLSLESWQTLPVDHVRLITVKLVPLLADPASPVHRAAILITASLLTSTPGRVLLHAKLTTCDDLWIDTKGNQFCWSMEMLREPETSGTRLKQTWIHIPFPCGLSSAIQALEPAMEAPGYFGDLLVPAGPTAWQGLIRQTHDLLMVLGEPAFPAFPGRWANSLSKVYLESAKSEILASVCTLDLALTPSAALFYFHPSLRDIFYAVSAVYHRLGLGSASGEEPSSTYREIPTNEQLKKGFQQMEERAEQLYRMTCSKRSDLSTCVSSCNELTQLTAATCVFLVGGRGSRVDEITAGALYCDADVLWLEDKKVEHEGSSRILPKSRHLKYWLHRLLVARQHLAERVSPTLRRDLASRWQELASGLLRFDAVAFEVIELQTGKVKCNPVATSDVENIAQRYFQESKNFMRRVLITHWTLAGYDRHLLRLITGHARSGLAVPAAGAMYTPQSAVLAARVILEKQLSQWLPDIGSSELRSSNYQFVALPGRRILKVHSAYRDHMQTWDAQVWSRWHLAATRIMNRLRTALLNGQGPQELKAQIWLHLVCFDGLNEPQDLEVVLSQPKLSFVLSTSGWLIHFKRADSNHPLIMRAQAPTALLLQRFRDEQEKVATEYSVIACQAGRWVAETTPDCWGETEGGVEDALLACSRLWTDWVLPPAVQLCYGPSSNAPLLDEQSNAALYGLPNHLSHEPTPPPVHRSHPDDLFNVFFKAINRLGSSRLKLGEQKERARIFDRWVSLGRIPKTGLLTSTLIQVVSVNARRIKAGKRGAIEWSSQATYFSNLRPFLQKHAHQMADDFDELDWLEFCKELQVFANQAEKQTVPAIEAAAWLSGCLRELGYPLPRQEAMQQMARQPVATTPSAIATITQRQLEYAKSLLSTISSTPLDQARFRLAISLFSTLPLRQGELAAISSHHVTADGQLGITTHGFAHLKSHASRRRLQLKPDAQQIMQTVVQQNREIQTLGSQNTLLFGSRDLKDGTTFLSSGWLMQALTWAIRKATGNSRFRIHSMRSHVVSNLLCPGWLDTTSDLKQDHAGPLSAKAIFAYQENLAWKTDLARLNAGHASIRTTLSYYFHAWIPVRTRALMATLAEIKPTDYLLSQTGVTQAALVKACSRNENFQKDPWTYLLAKLPAAHTSSSKAEILPPKSADASSLSSVDSNTSKLDIKSDPQHEKMAATPASWVMYLGLRLLGLERIPAENLLKLQQPAQVDKLDFLFAKSTFDQSALRGRIKGDISGRAYRADVKFLSAPWTIHIINTLTKLQPDELNVLLQLLLPKQSLLTWDMDVTRIAPFLDGSDICLEMVSDIKTVDPELNLRLSHLKSLVIAPPAHDVGNIPRLFIQPRDSVKQNTVAKARWTTLVRVLCCSLLLLNSSLPSQQLQTQSGEASYD